ncbi:hypothetical protein L4D00_11715 [Photobacterium swingsii]|uniref:hypothetical protein n=1 Tax=Photobacterium swingsii TaxID=680026 RepID=UPI003D0B8C6D
MNKPDYTSQKELFKCAYSSHRAAANGHAVAAHGQLSLSISFAYFEGKPELMMRRLYVANRVALEIMIGKRKASFQQSQKLRDAFAKRVVGGEL